MAGVSDVNKDRAEDEDNQQSNQGEPLTIASTGGAAPQQATNVRGGSIQGRAPTQSGRFVNIQNYLQGNKKGSEGLGKGIEAGAEKVAEQGRKELDTQKQAIEPGLTETETKGQTLTNETKNVGTGLGASETFQPSLIKAQEALDFSKNLKPQGLANPENITQSASKYQGLADLGKTDTGRQQLLQQTFQRPSYNQGQMNLDNLLLSASKGGSQALQRLQQKAPELKQELETGVGDVKKRIDAINKIYGTDLRGQVMGQVQTGEEAIKKQLEDQVKAYVAQENARMQNLQPGTIRASGNIEGLGSVANSSLDPNMLKEYIKYAPGATTADLSDASKMNALLSKAGSGGRASQFNQLAQLLGQAPENRLSENVGPLAQGTYDINQQGINQAYQNLANDVFTKDQGFNLPARRVDDKGNVINYTITNPAEALAYLKTRPPMYGDNYKNADARQRITDYVSQTAAQRLSGGTGYKLS